MYMFEIPVGRVALLRERCLRGSRSKSYISKGIRRQGIGSSVRNSYVSALCPVVICPYLCTSDEVITKILRGRLARLRKRRLRGSFRRSHLSSTTCLTPVLFNSGEECCT